MTDTNTLEHRINKLESTAKTWRRMFCVVAGLAFGGLLLGQVGDEAITVTKKLVIVDANNKPKMILTTSDSGAPMTRWVEYDNNGKGRMTLPNGDFNEVFVGSRKSANTVIHGGVVSLIDAPSEGETHGKIRMLLATGPDRASIGIYDTKKNPRFLYSDEADGTSVLNLFGYNKAGFPELKQVLPATN